MKIRRLKLSGFKSFVEPAELRIEPGLTGVVGPNGCGKSNLLEAIRWTMGESSPKSLRGGGMDDVIFAGTATRPPRDFAEVSILIERGTDDEGGAGEGEITRRIERGAGSAYRIDGRDVRAKDVALLFADAATGAHSPALVSQGKISSIISAKPVERRLLLEEAAGISGLHARRKDAEQKLRAAEANLARLGEILSDQEQRAAQLRRQARAAERYRKLTDQIRSVEAKLLHARWVEAEQAAQAATAEAKAAAEEVERIHQAIAEAQAAHDRASEELTAKRNARRRTSRAGPWARAPARDRPCAARHGRAPARRARPPRRLAYRRPCTRGGAKERRDAGDRAARRGAAAIEQRLDDAEGQAARIASELTEAETTSREAEAALAELLARQAAMRAERRVAEAALDAAGRSLQGPSRSALGSPSSLPLSATAANRSSARERRSEPLPPVTRTSEAEARRIEADEGRAAAAEPGIQQKPARVCERSAVRGQIRA